MVSKCIWTINEIIFLKRQAQMLYIVQRHPLDNMCFSQYQASSTVLGQCPSHATKAVRWLVTSLIKYAILVHGMASQVCIGAWNYQWFSWLYSEYHILSSYSNVMVDQFHCTNPIMETNHFFSIKQFQDVIILHLPASLQPTFAI